MGHPRVLYLKGQCPRNEIRSRIADSPFVLPGNRSVHELHIESHKDLPLRLAGAVSRLHCEYTADFLIQYLESRGSEQD